VSAFQQKAAAGNLVLRNYGRAHFVPLIKELAEPRGRRA
jgi:hypothetical protein